MTDEAGDVESAALRSLAFDAFPSEIAIIDEEGVILETNGSWEQFAIDNAVSFRPDMVGENYLSVCDAAEGDESAQTASAGIRAVLAGDRDAFSFEYPCHGPEERRWFMMRAIPIDYEGRRCVLVVHTDITDRREAELAVEERNDTLELLAGVLSHDLRNPLGVAMGRTEMLDAGDEHAAAIRSSLDRINAIVDDALLLARETDVDRLVAVDVGEAAREAWSHVDTGAATLAVASTRSVLADASLLCQLFENVFRNAVENAGEDAAVTVGTLDDEVGFFVADDGPGIPPDRRETVLDPGFTTNSDRGGTGLGLAIVDRIASTHGWSVRVADAEPPRAAVDAETGDDDRGPGARFEFSEVTPSE